MKTFKEHLKEGNVKSNANKYGAGTTGTSTSNAVEDSSLGTANLKDSSVIISCVRERRRHGRNGRWVVVWWVFCIIIIDVHDDF